jgi:hypothetical protein
MVLIAVIDAQIKSASNNTDEIVKQSPYWKKFVKVSHGI